MLHGSVPEEVVPGSETETDSEALGSMVESRIQKYRFWKRNEICDSYLEALKFEIGIVN
ncbi:hypothetical protein Bca4012_100304 [Brassica carinata]